jgi:hypothetical protein
MLKKIINVAVIIAALTFVTSCSDDDENPTNSLPESAEILVLDASAYDTWHYFSFSENKIIGTGSADPTQPDDSTWKERDDWDIAFNRYHIRTNSGTSVKANGGLL